MTTANESKSRYVDYLDPSLYSWTRPEGPLHIWRVVEGRYKTEDGFTLRFSIQEVPEELVDDVVEFMEKYLLLEEQFCLNLGVVHDLLAVCELRTLWRNVLRQGASVVALTLNANPVAKPVIAGVNVLMVTTAEDKPDSEKLKQFRTQPIQTMIGSYVIKASQNAQTKKNSVDKLLRGLGLSVHPSLRGQGLGEEIIRAHEDIGRTYKIPRSEMFLTMKASQILAARAGYEILYPMRQRERKYSELFNDKRGLVYPGVIMRSIQVMGRKLY